MLHTPLPSRVALIRYVVLWTCNNRDHNKTDEDRFMLTSTGLSSCLAMTNSRIIPAACCCRQFHMLPAVFRYPSGSLGPVYKELAKFGKAAAEPFRHLTMELTGSKKEKHHHSPRLRDPEQQYRAPKAPLDQMQMLISMMGMLNETQVSAKEHMALMRLDLQQHTALQVSTCKSRSTVQAQQQQ